MTPQPGPQADAVIVAAGRSSRMGGTDKLWAPVTGSDGRCRPLLAYTLDAFQACPSVRRVVLVMSAAWERVTALTQDGGFDKLFAVVPGGPRRQDSVRAGIEALSGCAWVVVHDGARPLVSPDLIDRGLGEAQETGASTCAVPVSDTLKESDNSGHVIRTRDRSGLWLAQTPQVFRYELLLEAHNRAEVETTDDAALVEAAGVKVRLCFGSPRNLKVTTPDDLAMAAALLAHSS